MTTEAKRIKIAEACGWKLVKWEQGGWQAYNPEGERVSDLVSGSKEAAAEQYAPNYFECLNAMHEAEKVLSPQDAQRYFRHIRDSTPAPADDNYSTIENFYIHATAIQRAECFGAALNLW